MCDCMTQEDAMNMSNEQAIQILKPFRDMMIDQHGCPISNVVFALDKAIEALSLQSEAVSSDRDCVDLSEKVTATFYDDEYEEWLQMTVTIRDVLDSVCDSYTVIKPER